MLFQGPENPFVEETLMLPESLNEGEILVALSLATICGSDLHTVSGKRSSPLPAVLGHEGVGTVVSLGKERDPNLLGRRVTWSLTDSCGLCEPCSQWDLPQKCQALFKYGHAGSSERGGLTGCFASHIILSSGTAVFPIPDGVTDVMAAPANCALATMMAVTETIPHSHRSVLIQGAGLLGLYGAVLLKERRHHVLVVDPSEARLQLASDFGADITRHHSRDISSDSVDAVIEVAGTSEVISEGIRILRPGGFYALAGLVHPESQIELTGEQLIRKCVTMRGFHNYRPVHLEHGLGFLEKLAVRYPWHRLVSDPLPLEALDGAFELARSRRWHRVAISCASRLSP